MRQALLCHRDVAVQSTDQKLIIPFTIRFVSQVRNLSQQLVWRWQVPSWYGAACATTELVKSQR